MKKPLSPMTPQLMTPLRKRFIEDMQLSNLAPATQRSYLFYAIGLSQFYHCSPAELDLEAIRQYKLHLLNEKKLSPESINTFNSAAQFLFLRTLEMPWDKSAFDACPCRVNCRSCSVRKKSPSISNMCRASSTARR